MESKAIARAVASAISPTKACTQEAGAYLYRSDAGGWKAIDWKNHPMEHIPLSMAIDPEEPGTLYAGVPKGDVWRSPDPGGTWQEMPLRFRGIWRSILLLGC
jgi:hypothetical protein